MPTFDECLDGVADAASPGSGATLWFDAVEGLDVAAGGAVEVPPEPIEQDGSASRPGPPADRATPSRRDAAHRPSRMSEVCHRFAHISGATEL